MLLALGCMDIDLALRIDEPETPTEQSTQANCALYERWERSNRLSMMVIKTHISQSIRGSIPECRTVKELMGAIDEQFVSSDKAQASTLMAKLCSMRLKGTQNVRGHISVLNNHSSSLWHRRLGHISIERLKRLVKDGVIQTLDFTDFDTCLGCIKGKQTNKSNKGAKRSDTKLKIIHTDICGPFTTQCLNGQRYFITFIDDFTRYMYLYLLYDKSEALDAFKVYKAEVEKQSGLSIKIVRSDRGGEYYGRFTDQGQRPGPFAKFLKENGIVAQYTTPGTPQQNGVAERRNRTLMDMVRSMTSVSNLPPNMCTF